jgi:hypothetical protein
MISEVSVQLFDSLVSESGLKQNIILQHSCLPHGSWEAKRKRGRGRGPKIITMTYFFQLGPTSQ